jgi:hypothetical protein
MKMQMSQFDSIVNVIQMKLMKVINIFKNMMSQEFQHSRGFEFISGMNLKMQMLSDTINAIESLSILTQIALLNSCSLSYLPAFHARSLFHAQLKRNPPSQAL